MVMYVQDSHDSQVVALAARRGVVGVVDGRRDADALGAALVVVAEQEGERLQLIGRNPVLVEQHHIVRRLGRALSDPNLSFCRQIPENQAKPAVHCGCTGKSRTAWC